MTIAKEEGDEGGSFRRGYLSRPYPKGLPNEKSPLLLILWFPSCATEYSSNDLSPFSYSIRSPIEQAQMDSRAAGVVECALGMGWKGFAFPLLDFPGDFAWW